MREGGTSLVWVWGNRQLLFWDGYYEAYRYKERSLQEILKLFKSESNEQFRIAGANVSIDLIGLSDKRIIGLVAHKQTKKQRKNYS